MTCFSPLFLVTIRANYGAETVGSATVVGKVA
jgi:hypothetical protein